MGWFRREEEKPECEGKAAREKAQEHLDEANGQWESVREVAASLRRMKQQNNFAKAIENIMRGEAK